MLAATLIPLLAARFSGRPFVVGDAPDLVVTFPAAHPNVGDLVIRDDGDEFTVYVGTFTHIHFNHYDDALSDRERSTTIVDNLLNFLDDVFADRMEFFGSQAGGGGCRLRGTQHDVVSNGRVGEQIYVWSGPVSNAH